MNNKFITSSQFFNNWARTNRDPDGNYIHTYVSGGNDDSYNQWLRNKQIETKSLNTTTKYKWVSENTNCFKCKSLDGKIFDYKPNVEEIAHPNCKCEVVEVSEVEAEEVEMKREEEMGKRDKLSEQIAENAKDLTRVKKDANGKIELDEKGKKQYYDPKTGTYKPLGECARYTREAIEKGTGDVLDRTRYAGDYGKSLEKVNWHKIPTNENYKPQKGDVRIYSPIEGTANGREGHMQMFDGKQWISDYRQGESYQATKHGDKTGEYPNDKYKDGTQYKPQTYRNPKWEE
jgi:hypothetical protein